MPTHKIDKKVLEELKKIFPKMDFKTESSSLLRICQNQKIEGSSEDNFMFFIGIKNNKVVIKFEKETNQITMGKKQAIYISEVISKCAGIL